MTAMDMAKLLARCRTGGGRKSLTVFVGHPVPATVAALDRTAREQRALIFFLHDGPDPLTLPDDSPLFHAAVAAADLPAQFAALCQHFLLEEGFQIKTMCEPGAEPLLERWREPLLTLLSNLKFRRRAEVMLWRCLLRNLPNIQERRPLPAPADPNAAVLICAAGPSLARQGEILRRFRHRFHLFCVGRALPRLQAAGVTPDLVVEIDAESRIAGQPDRPLAAAVTAAPDVTSAFHPVLWLADPDPERHAVVTAQVGELPSVALARSVVVTALDLAVKAGYRRIALTGSDLCLADDGSLYGNRNELDFGTPVAAVRLPGNDVPEVISTPGLAGIRDAVQSYLAACPVPVVHCTDGGARLDHTVRQSLEDWAEQQASAEPFVLPPPIPRSILAASPGSAGPEPAIVRWLETARREARPGHSFDQLETGLRQDVRSRDGEVFRYPSFRAFALACVRRRNPAYADWLATLPDDESAPDGFTVDSLLLLLPQVRQTDGTPLTPGDNREQTAYDMVSRFAVENKLNAATDAVAIAGPGDWAAAAELARCYPTLPLLVIDPHPRLFRRIMDYTLFLHWFDADTLIAGVGPGVPDNRRGIRQQLREWQRAGRRILTFTPPALRGRPEVEALRELTAVPASTTGKI